MTAVQIGTDEHAASTVRRLQEDITRALEELGTCGNEPATAALRIALVALDETLLRLGVAFPGEPEDPQDHPLVLGVDPRVGPDERFDSRFWDRIRGITSE